MTYVDVLIREAYDLEPLPQSVARLTALFANDDWSLQDITKTIELDPALTAKLLKLANSSLSGASQAVTSVETAVVRMGPGMVLSLAIASAVRPEMSVAIPAYDLDEGSLWRHSVAAAIAVEEAKNFCRRPAPPESFVSALLHDIGKLVIGRHLKPALVSALDSDPERPRPLRGIEAESETLGLHHGKLGGLIARNWELPQGIPAGITFHHSPEKAPDEFRRTIASYVALGDFVAHEIGEQCGNNDEPRLTRATVKCLGLTRNCFTELCQSTAARLDSVMQQYEE